MRLNISTKLVTLVANRRLKVQRCKVFTVALISGCTEVKPYAPAFGYHLCKLAPTYEFLIDRELAILNKSFN